MSRIVKKPEERKEELLNIAEKLFMENGYEQTSIRDIYTQANGSFGMFYHHFKSKEEVLEEVSKRMAQTQFEKIKAISLNENQSSIEKLQSIVLSSILSMKECAINNSILPFYKNPQLLVVQLHDTLGLAAEFFSYVIEEGMNDGTIPGTQPHELAQMILLFLNIWLNPLIYAWKTEELRNIFKYINDLLDKIGVPVFTEEAFSAIEELYSVMKSNKEKGE
ncbi:MAG: TetR/AcrR family transcriptional regulator [Candidatus Dehalobacter alkaniphilus]